MSASLPLTGAPLQGEELSPVERKHSKTQVRG